MKHPLFRQTERQLTFTYTKMVAAVLLLFITLSIGGVFLAEWHTKTSLLNELLAMKENRPPRPFDDDDALTSFVVREADFHQVDDVKVLFQLERYDLYEVDDEQLFLMTTDGYKRVAVNVSDEWQLLKLLLLISFSLFIGFIGLLYVIGLRLARKAMAPIEHSFQQQRQFVADASHELRTPLAILQASVDVLKDEVNDPLLIEDMQDELRRTTKLVNDLLQLARLDSQSLTVTRTEQNITALTERAIQPFRLLAEQKQLTIVWRSESTFFALIDEEKWRQLVYILLDNAVKYSDAQAGDITVELQNRGKQYALIVSDCGIGISPERQATIFERFVRLDDSRQRQTGGAGLGLAIAASLVQLLDGSITVESTPANGTTFTILLPK